MKKKKSHTVIIVIIIAIILMIVYVTCSDDDTKDSNPATSDNVNILNTPGETNISETPEYEKADTYRNPFWDTVFEIPTDEQISQYNATNQKRSPYIAGFFQMPADTKYTEYMIDFRADCVANGTYISLANWGMDDTELKKQYESVKTNGISAYAGFQKLGNGQMYSIMSFWDIFCKDKSGNDVKIRAERVFPEITGSKEDFGGEGTGAHHSDPYPWESDHWYRMHLKCSTSYKTGNTIVEQGVWDLATGTYTTLCIYDIGFKNSTFKGPVAVFLENFDVNYAGEVRTLEICNAKYLDATTKQWNDLKQIYIESQQPMADQALYYNGSYNFGVTENRFWMITSGLGGDWNNNGLGKKGTYLSVN